MSDDELFSALSEIADEEIMAKNRASIVEVGQRICRAALEEACAAIKAEDDRQHANDYMLDSDDCINVIRALSKEQQ